jgi:hypothetical protein
LVGGAEENKKLQDCGVELVRASMFATALKEEAEC